MYLQPVTSNLKVSLNPFLKISKRLETMKIKELYGILDISATNDSRMTIWNLVAHEAGLRAGIYEPLPEIIWDSSFHGSLLNRIIIELIPVLLWYLRWASPAMQETRLRSLGWEDPLEKDMATHPSILAWRIPMDRGAWQVTYSPWGCKESEMTEHLSAEIFFKFIL